MEPLPQGPRINFQLLEVLVKRLTWGGKPLVVGLIVALLVGTTGAVAGSLITSKDIANGTIKGKDLSKKVRAKINKAAVAGTAGAPGQTGPQGVAGNPGQTGPAGADGDDGTDGANGLDSGTPRVVTATNLQGWTLLLRGTTPDPSDNGIAEFAGTPAVEPLGTSALRMRTDNGKNISAVIPLPVSNTGHFPRLEELTTATYSSYVDVQPQPQLDITLKLVLAGANACGTGGSGCPGNNATGFTTFVFDPSLNRDQNPDVTDTWQRWDAEDGKWFSTRGLADSDCQQSGDPTNGVCTIEDFLSDPANRDAVVQSARLEIGQTSGAGWVGFDGYADDTRLGFDGGFTRYDLGG